MNKFSNFQNCSDNEKQELHILLINDDRATVDLVKSLSNIKTTSVQFTISEAKNFRLALKAIAKQKPDVVIACLESVKNDILSLIYRFRYSHPEIPIIAIGSKNNEKLALDAICLGAQDCIIKENFQPKKEVSKIIYAIERGKLTYKIHDKQIAATIEAVSDAILITNADKKVLYANNAAEKLLWKSSKKLIGKTIPVPIDPEQKIQHTFKTPNKDQLIVMISTTPVPWNDNEQGYCITINDITDHKLHQEELKRAAKVKDEFIAHLSHELRTPMNGIIGMTSLLIESDLNPQARKYVETIRKSGENMLDIINDLLDLSKIEAGKLELENNKFSIEDLVNDTLDTFSPIAKKKNFLLTAIIDEDLPDEIISDDSRIRQVLANLVSNAIKHTDHGFVSVRVSNEQDQLVSITVRDSGTGISKKNQGSLFEPFHKLSISPTRNVEGTGLGLAISKKLTHLLGGEIKCKSSLKWGSEFKFSFINRGENQRTNNLVQTFSHKVGTFSKNGYFNNLVQGGLKRYNIQCVTISNHIEKILPTISHIIVDSESYSAYKKITDKLKFDVGKNIQEIIIGSKTEGQVVSPLVQITDSPLNLQSLAKIITNPVQIESNTSNTHNQTVSNDYNTFESFRAKRILVAEDNIINQKVALSILSQLGLQADCVSNGVEAVEACKNYNYSAILMDCRMPVMDGYEAAQAIRKLSDHYRNCGIFAVTANALKSERYKTDDANMDAHISKPITIDIIRDLLISYFQNCPIHMEFNNSGKNNSKDKPGYLDSDVIESLRKVGDKIDKDLLNEVTIIFENSSPEILKDLHAAINSQDLKQISFLSHKLKGSARNIGATRLANLCSDLETSSKDHLQVNHHQLLEKISKEYDLVCIKLENYCVKKPIHSNSVNSSNLGVSIV